MKLIAFVEGRPKPQPRTTQRSKFLFSRTVEQWEKVDEDNKVKTAKGLLNKKGNAYKETRYGYRLKRLLDVNEYRKNIFEVVCKACNNGIFTSDDKNIPKRYLFIFYLFHSPKSWSKKKHERCVWELHDLKPDCSNITKGVEDAMYISDSDVTANAHYKLYVPHNIPQGILILQDEEIHKFVIETAIETILKTLIK